MKKLLVVILLTFSSVLFAVEIKTPYLEWVLDRCALYDVPPDIAIAVAVVESNFDMVISPENNNKTYDIGIFQLNSNFIEWFEKALWYKGRDFNPYNPQDNIEMGIIYLRHLYNKTHNWDLAVKAFNIGLHGLKKDPDRAQEYFIRVSNVITTLEYNPYMN